ncbi:MAG: hypothetical protein J1F23_05905 [Oscillospiraceae bacterium]|nr:hypothetical protein [Oscillospiraceae bacterium]
MMQLNNEKYHLLLKLNDKPSIEFVETDKLAEWISEETDEMGQPLYRRIPCEKTDKFLKEIGFEAAGKTYTKLKKLTAICIDKEKSLYKDTFGRRVFVYRERFPCFDSFDFLHENRYYNWFYILSDDRLTCVYCKDEQKEIEVTEDVRTVPKGVWEKMQRCGILDNDSILKFDII